MPAKTYPHHVEASIEAMEKSGGAAHPDTPAEWARLALACLDQAGVGLMNQQQIATFVSDSIGEEVSIDG